MKSYRINGNIIDLCIIIAFTLFSIFILRGLAFQDFVTWDLSVPHFNAGEYAKWTFRPSDSISFGGEWIFPTYPTFLESLLTFLTNNLLAAKLFTILPIPFAFVIFYYSCKRLTLGRVSSVSGAFFYAVSPVSFALLLSPGQQWFYALLPLVITMSIAYFRTILNSDKFKIYPVIILSILYAIALGFMLQGILLIVPIIFVINFYFIIRYHQNLKFKVKRLLWSGGIISIVSFGLLLPISASFILPHFSFLSTGKFVSDPFQPTRNILYENTKIYNTIRLVGIGDYHVAELGYNSLTDPINILGLIMCLSILVFPLAVIYKDRYRHRLMQITSKYPLKLDLLVIVITILFAGLVIIELGRDGILWQIPLGSLLRNPIKPMMLIAVSLSFLVSYMFFLVPYFTKLKSKILVPLIFAAIICSSIIYSSRYMDGTGWIGPNSKYWESQGVRMESKDSLVTASMRNLAGFAWNSYKTDLEPYRFFIFPLMPTQLQYFRYNLPLISGDAAGAYGSEKRFLDYINDVNGLMLSGDNRSAISLSPLRGKYIGVLTDANSAMYKGEPHKWGGTPGALTGDPEIFKKTISTIQGLVKIPGRDNIFINNYTVLPLVSYADTAILLEGNFSTLFNLYDYITPRENATIIPIFADQTNQKDFSTLVPSGLVNTVVHNSTDSVSDAETDLYVISLKDLKQSYYYKNKYRFTNLIPVIPNQDSSKNLSINLTNSTTTQMIVKYPTGGDNVPSISYVPEAPINLSRFDTLLLNLSSEFDNLEYRISMFDDVGRQLLLVVKDSGKGVNFEHQLKIADGLIFDKDGISIVNSMNYDNIRRLQIGFVTDNKFWSEHPGHIVKATIGIPYLANQKDRVNEVQVPNLPMAKQYSGLWIKHPSGDVGLRMNSVDYRLFHKGPIFSFSTLPDHSKHHNQTLTITTEGEAPVGSLIFATSKHEIKDLTSEVLSDLNLPIVRGDESTAFSVQFPSRENKILILSLLDDGQWQSDSTKSITIYGFLNGYVLTQGQESIYLKNYLLRDVIYKLFIIFLVCWTLILLFLGLMARKSLKHRIWRLASRTN